MSDPSTETQLTMIDGRDALLMVLVKPGTTGDDMVAVDFRCCGSRVLPDAPSATVRGYPERVERVRAPGRTGSVASLRALQPTIHCTRRLPVCVSYVQPEGDRTMNATTGENRPEFEGRAIAVPLAYIDKQREAGWPDMHPEEYCHRCGGRNISWWIDNDVWNAIMRPDGPDSEWKWNEIICPICFGEMFQAVYPRTSFSLAIDEATKGARRFRLNVPAVLAALAVPATPRNLVTPCHGRPFTILTRTEGSGHLTTDVPDEILCPADHCFNSWDANGVADEYNKEVTP